MDDSLADQDDLQTEEVRMAFDEAPLPAVLIADGDGSESDARYERAMRRIGVMTVFGACGLVAYAWLITEYAG